MVLQCEFTVGNRKVVVDSYTPPR